MAVQFSTRLSRLAKNQVRPEFDKVPTWAHPDVLYWYDQWQKIRDCIEGERAIKSQRTLYLDKLEGMESEQEYDAYLSRGTFYNFTGRTVLAMTGTLFRRQPQVSGLPEALEDGLEDISDEGASFRVYTQQVGQEVLTLARVGVLLDLPEGETTNPQPYFTTYTAENIIDWREGRDPKTGRKRLEMVTLREFHMIDEPIGDTTVHRYAARYRKLEIIGGRYVVQVYESATGDADLSPGFLVNTIYPTRRGVALEFIPFKIFGVVSSNASVEKPTTLDIADLNISHYKSYAHLEHGRFFVGLPIYWAEKISDEGGDYVLGPSRVWELEKGAGAGIIECNGQGLKFLENACATKEAQAASLGGRLIGVTAQSTAETDNQTALKERNEQAILLCIALGLDAGFTTLLRWWAWWSNESEEDVKAIEVEFNKDFLFDTTGAREFRAIQSMYKEGLIPVEVLYDALRKAEVIPDFMQIEEFKALLNSKGSFPNDPNFQARKEGYPDAQAKVTAENQGLQRDADQTLLDTELESDAEQADLDRAEAEKARKVQKETAVAVAKAAPKPAPGAPAGKGAPARPAPKN